MSEIMGRMIMTFLILAILQSKVRCNDCNDDVKIDCVMLTSMINICTVNTEIAAKLCPKTCNLCSNLIVDGNWTDWSTWSACAITCGNTTQTRTRTCTNPPPSTNGTECEGTSEDYQPCLRETCPVDGNWTDWSSWSACSVTCGSAMQSRIRTCTNPTPSHKGTECEGSSEDYKNCLQEPCRVNVGWGQWNEWGSCSSTFGIGIQHRNRSCYKPVSRSTYDVCFGDTTNTQLCMQDAYADGGWAAWSPWNTCSVTCGIGVNQRTRTCTNPKPTPFGHQCEGPNIDVAICHIQQCPTIAGEWSAWRDWNVCTVTSLVSTRDRFRECTKLSHSPYETICTGHTVDVGPCPVDGNWTDWSTWSACAITCGNTTQTRTRTCTNPPPSNKGTDCEGTSEDYHPCLQEPCPVDGNWSDWSGWSACSATCGHIGRWQSRIRTCTNPQPSLNGKACKGSMKDYSAISCRMKPCNVF